MFAALLLSSLCLRAAEIEEGRKLFLTGNYSRVITVAEKELKGDDRSEEWWLLLVQAQLATGRYAEARTAVERAINLLPTSIQIRLAAHEVFRRNGAADRARTMLDEINTLASTREWQYRDARNRVALGRAAVLLGADPRRVLEVFYEPVKKLDADSRDVHLAMGELALAKHDFALAGRAFQDGLKKFPGDADFHYGLAAAFADSDSEVMLESIQSALNANSNHVATLLLIVDQAVDAEEYAEAEENLDRILQINPHQPEAHAYQAVLAHLRADPAAEKRHRSAALKFWSDNPGVDHLIGRKLSQKYRFTEGAGYQRQALAFDSDYLPAKIQLAQDLLRLGEDEEGWRLAEQVHKEDGYDVTAYNLITLKDSVSHFATLTNADFILRMDPKEAAIYGERALALLTRAKSNLTAKYGIELPKATTVEIFAQQKDFAIRTFGMPGGSGFLGVCFGCVITANSPATRPNNPSNWEAILWHEFCHVVTLQMTKNKMPRWLSEGISVYEERQANPTWGEQLTPQYREMLLREDLTPVGSLSAAFLHPKSALHLQFAYYQSSLVVEYLVGKFGFDSLKKILRDLAGGVPINTAIARHTAPIEQINKEFAAFARERAEKMAPGLEWEKPPASLARSKDGLTEWIEKNPKNFYALTQQAKKLVGEKKWTEAKAVLQRLIELFPAYAGRDNAYELLASVHRELKETAAERAVLEQLAARTPDDTETFLRLMELAAAERDWVAVAQNARRFLAVNPLLAPPHRYLAQAAEATGAAPEAIESYRALLKLDPPDPAETHFRLARLLHQAGDAAARRHVLMALEEAPRYQAAHKLLLEIETRSPRNKPAPQAINF
jgi:tetratricopeptide (TPR) repeat protein